MDHPPADFIRFAWETTVFTIEFLSQIRACEIEAISSYLPAGARVLEIGAGTGQQALALRKAGFQVEAIEIPASNYIDHQAFPITAYDGRHIPFPDESFDVVFSSNVLEHVKDLSGLEAEIKRVLRPGGKCVHIMPTHAWRLWTTLSAFPAGVQKALLLARGSGSGSRRGSIWRVFAVIASIVREVFAPFFQGRHGERGSIVSELWLFHPSAWRRHFKKSGFEILRDEPMGLHYTGHFVFGPRWCLDKRARVAKRLGSACHLFEVRAAQSGTERSY